jgi:GNAT superfamily N-acetyltransferase
VPFHLLSRPSPADRWRPALEAGLLWVARDDEPVAFLAATRTGPRLHIDEFDVARAHQGRGLGRRMLAHVIEWARAAGVESLSLTTFRSVPWNGPFYASCGFAEWPEGVPEILAAEAAKGLQDRIAMRLAL